MTGQKLVHDRETGENLRYLRKRADLLQREVAARLQVQGLDVSRGVYSQIEAGIHHIDIRILRELKRMYHASWEEIFDGPQGGDRK